MAWFHNLPLRWKLLGAFGVILSLVLAFSALAYRTSLLEERASREVERNLEILALANDAHVSLVDMQTGYRGFLLTGDEAFLEPYTEEQQSYPAKLTDLAKLDRAKAADVGRWREIEQRALAWQRDVTEPGIALRREVNTGAIPAERVSEWASTSGGKVQFDAIRALFEAAIADEQAELTALGEDARAAEERLRASLMWGTAGTIGLALVVAVLLSRDIVGAVGRVAVAAREIGRGRLDHRVGLRRSDEIGQTGAVFDRMAGRLQQMVQELERAVAAARTSEARAGAVTDNVAEGIFTFDERGVIASFNRAAERIFGYRAAEVIGHHVDLLLPKADAGASGAKGNAQTGMPWSEGGAVSGVSRELLGRRAGGALFPMDLVVSDMRLGGLRQFIGVARDISERKRAGQRLRESEERLRLALDAARMGTWEWNIPTNELIWSDHVKLLHGLPPAAAGDLHAHFERTIDPDDRAAVAQQEAQSLATGADYEVEYRVVRPDGSVRWVAAKGRVDRGEDGQPLRLHGVATDVTARKQAEAAIRESDARNRALVDAIPDLMFRLRGDGTYLDYNADREGDLAAPPSLFLDRKLTEVLPPDVAGQAMEAIQQTLSTGSLQTFEYHLTLEGERRDFEARMIASGPDEVVTIVRNVTERKRFEEALAAERDLLRMLMDNAPDLIYFKDADGRFVRLNEPAARNLGCPDPALALGKTDRDFFPGAEGEAAFADEQRMLRGGEPLVNRLVEHAGGPSGPRWLLNSKVPIRDRTGRIVGLIGIGRDITEHRRAEEALRESERRYRDVAAAAQRQARELALLDEVRTALARELDLPVVFRTVVDAIAQTFGYTQVSLYLVEGDELVLQHQVGYDRVIERVPIAAGVSGRVVRTGEPVLLEDVRDDPAFLGAIEGIASEICVPLRDQGQVVGTLNVESTGGVRLGDADLRLVLALSEHVNLAIGRSRLYAAVRESETRFAAFMGNSPALAWMKDEDCRYVYVNEPYERLAFRTRQEIAGRDDFEIWPDVAATLRANDQAVLSSGQALETYESVPTIDGRLVTYLVFKFPFQDASGKRFVGGMGVDVTERLRAEAELERQYREAERARGETDAVLDATNEAMILIAPDRRVLTVNRRFGELFGVDAHEVPGRPIDAFGDLIDRTFADPGDFRRQLAGAIADAEARFSRVVSQQWPEPRELELTSAPVRDGTGEHLGRLFAYRDVTRERAVDRMKTEFVSLVSHELRTPLTSIKGYVDLMLDGEVGEVPPDQREFLEIVRNNAQRLVTLINDLLDISRIEAGKVELKPAALDLGRLIEGVVTSLRPQVEGKQQRLGLDLPKDLAPVWGDADRVAQILTNLLSNAHKYTPAGGAIRVAVERQGKLVRVDVQDTGIGMTPEEQEQLFTKFFRAKNRATQEVGGTGLGLVITRSLVEMHGGTLEAVSAPGKGTIFSFTLPIARSDTADLEPAAAVGNRGGRILVVEDEPDIAHLIRRYLERAGYEVLLAGTAADARRLARAERPDLITLDLVLPDANGLTLLEWLKSEAATEAIPVMLLSILPDDNRGKLLGAVDYLTKPVQERDLLDRVAWILSGEPGQTVLVADDDADTRALIAGHLRRVGCEVLEAMDGDEAVDLARRHHPALLLIDVRMPGTDGFGAVQALRADPATRDLPVVVMTGSPGAEEESRRGAIAALGVSQLLRKPFSARELTASIARGLNGGAPRGLSTNGTNGLKRADGPSGSDGEGLT